MSWPKELAQIGRLLLNGQLTELKTVLDGYKARTASEARIKAHYMALIDFHKGDIAQARIGLEKAVADFGENVNLMRDLATCFYHQQDMLAFRLCLDKLERTLIEQEDKLSRRSFLECETMIGKFLEEEGKLAPALIFYERALLRTNSPGERLRVILQKARWVALYEPSHELGSLYRELISVPTDSVSQDMRIEIEHNLLLIELRLIGADHAWQRFERLGSDVPEIDRRLLIFDFIEGCLAQDIAISSAVLAMIDQFKTFDPYEDFLRKLIHGQLEGATKTQELTKLAPKLPWASYLRLLCLSANLESLPSAKMELNRKIQLIIKSLDPKSQHLWNSRLKQALQTPEIKVEFCSRSRSVTIQGKTVDLSKKKIGQQLLAILSKQPSLSVDQAIEHLWQSTFSPEHYHRLRMGVHRLNTLINESSGHGKIIEVDSQEVRLRPEVKLRPADELLDSSLGL